MSIEAIIFDWGRTLFDSETKEDFPDSERVIKFCKEKGLRLCVASLVSIHSNIGLEGREHQIENSPLRQHFEFVSVTDKDKDVIIEEIVNKLALPREKIMIVDDRMLRGIKYGNLRGHPTVWVQKGKFENELPNEETKEPSFIIHSIGELEGIIDSA